MKKQQKNKSKQAKYELVYTGDEFRPEITEMRIRALEELARTNQKQNDKLPQEISEVVISLTTGAYVKLISSRLSLPYLLRCAEKSARNISRRGSSGLDNSYR